MGLCIKDGHEAVLLILWGGDPRDGCEATIAGIDGDGGWFPVGDVSIPLIDTDAQWVSKRWIQVEHG